MNMLTNSFSKSYSDYSEFEKLKLQVETSFFTRKNTIIVFCYKNDRIISYKNSWFAIIKDIKFPNYDHYIIKLLERISTGKISLDSLKRNKEIEVVFVKNKGIIYCDSTLIQRIHFEYRNSITTII